MRNLCIVPAFSAHIYPMDDDAWWRYLRNVFLMMAFFFWLSAPESYGGALNTIQELKLMPQRSFADTVVLQKKKTVIK